MSFSLPTFLEDSYLNSLRFQMGASLSGSFKIARPVRVIELPELARTLRGSGVEVNSNEVTVLPDGTLAYKNHRVLVYIRDIASYGDRQSQPKYHLCNCSTLEHMRSANRWRRYVVANRDDGEFQVNVIESNTSRAMAARLDVCQNCLAHLRWNGFDLTLTSAERTNRVRTFQLPDFFERYPRDLVVNKPVDSSDSAPLNVYPDNWGDISEHCKANAGYRCAQCSLTLSLRDSRFLHTHHRNGLKHDCRAENLEVLCIQCHSDEPLHAHLKGTPDYEEFVTRFRV